MNKTISPSPAPEQRPATKLPKERTPVVNNSTSKTEIAQLGIKPTMPVIKGWNMLLLTRSLEIVSVPIKYTRKFMISEAIKRYKAI